MAEKRNGEEGVRRCERREMVFFMIIITMRIATVEPYI
jgi:hypothetical protein